MITKKIYTPKKTRPKTPKKAITPLARAKKTGDLSGDKAPKSLL
jgi:hypothetical protein